MGIDSRQASQDASIFFADGVTLMDLIGKKDDDVSITRFW